MIISVTITFSVPARKKHQRQMQQAAEALTDSKSSVHVSQPSGDSKKLLSDRWIRTEQHITWYYALPFAPMVLIAFWLLPWSLFVIHALSLAFTVWWHVFLHRQYHVRGVWLERFEWFREKRRLHFVHHKRPRKNYAIVEYGWDRLFGTFNAG